MQLGPFLAALGAVLFASGCPGPGDWDEDDDDETDSELPTLEITSIAFSPDCTEETTGCLVGDDTTVTVLVGFSGDPVDIVGVRLTSGTEQYAVLTRDLSVDPRVFSATFANPEYCVHWYYPDGTNQPSTRELRMLGMVATASDIWGQEASVNGPIWLGCPAGEDCRDYDPWAAGGPDYTGGQCY